MVPHSLDSDLRLAPHGTHRPNTQSMADSQTLSSSIIMETPTSKITSKILYMKTRNSVSDSSLSIHPIEAQQKSIMLGSPIHSNKLSESVLDLVRARPNPANQIRNHPVGPNSRSYREDANPDLISSESAKPLKKIHIRARRAKGPIIPTFETGWF